MLTSFVGLLAFMVQGKGNPDAVALSSDQASALFFFVTALALALPSIVLALRDEEHH